MTRIIPDKDLEKFIQATGWIPGQEIPLRQPVNNPNRTQPAMPQNMVNINDILKGKMFYDGNLADALQQALEHAGSTGYVATMPELIAAKVKAGKNHDFYKNWLTVHTEENIGIDQKGRFYGANEPVLVLVNGGGILTPKRIKQAYDEGLVSGSAKYTNQEFDDLLDGKLPDGSGIKLYHFDDEIKKGVSDLPHQFGIVMPYSVAQNTESTYVKKREFLANSLVMARNAGMQNLEEYFERAKDTSDDTLGCYHPFGGRDASTPQGRVLFLYSDYGGLGGDDNLYGGGRFVGVAPEAPSARK
ncbi:MAG: hypothetical protein K9N07_07755 [Candidatus Cloacimonetes bacterium]|nr:hypothetical protein [Candidatus Cloacimonadota bacterium]MCF8012777.1 hypothetical protein [Candidatus Woesearchaeota archaeon]